MGRRCGSAALGAAEGLLGTKAEGRRRRDKDDGTDAHHGKVAAVGPVEKGWGGAERVSVTENIESVGLLLGSKKKFLGTYGTCLIFVMRSDHLTLTHTPTLHTTRTHSTTTRTTSTTTQ